MTTRSYRVKSSEGLHARPATTLAKIANQYDNAIHIEYDGKRIDLKSVIGVMSLGIASKETFSITVEGNNSETIHHDFETVLKENHII